MESRQNVAESRQKYLCKKCDYTTSNKNDWTKHVRTRKHKMITNGNALPFVAETEYICKCGKIYKYKSGLCRHIKICSAHSFAEPVLSVPQIEQAPQPELTNHFVTRYQNRRISGPDRVVNEFVRAASNREINMYDDEEPLQPANNYLPSDINRLLEQHKNELCTMAEIKKIVMILVNQNTDFQKKLIEQNEKIIELSSKSTAIVNSNNNSNNHFNINMFLNEKCKNAISINDFMKTLVIDADSVQYSATHGFVNGVTNIITNGLNKLDQYTRPFHCTDLKREIMYVKVADAWKKDTNGNAIMMNVINMVVERNVRQIPAWADANPESNDVESELFDAQFAMLREVTGGSGDKYVLNTERVFRKLAKDTLIDKSMSC